MTTTTYKGEIVIKERLVFHKNISDRIKSRVWKIVAIKINNLWKYWSSHRWRFLLGEPTDAYTFEIRDEKGNFILKLETYAIDKYHLDEIIKKK